MWALLGLSAVRWIFGGTIIIAMIGGLYVKGRIDGNAACIVTQNKQMARMESYVKEIRSRIERNLPIGDDILRTDPFEREP